MNELSTQPRRGCGRGKNANSRKNLLAGIPSDAFVWERGAGIGWTCLDGPMPYHKAYAAAARLEEKNATGQQMYAATRSPELVGKIKAGDHLPK